MTSAEILDIVARRKSSILGLNIFSTNLLLVGKIVEHCPANTTIIIGGPASKHVYQEVLSWQTCNPINIVLGEGEYIVADIIDGSTKELLIHAVADKKVYVVNEYFRYFPHDISNIPLEWSLFKKQPIKHKLGFTESHIITSRRG